MLILHNYTFFELKIKIKTILHKNLSYNNVVIIMKKINLFLVFLISFIYMEFLYKILVHNQIFRLSIVNMLLFLIPLSLLLGLLTNLSQNKKISKIIFIVILSLVAVWFSAEYVIKDYYNFYLSWGAFKVADQVGEFAGKGIIETIKRLPGIIMFFAPLIVSLIFRDKLDFQKFDKKGILVLLALIVTTYGVYLLGLYIDKNKSYSPYNLYYQVNDISLNVETFGVLNTLFIDTKRSIFGFEEKIIINNGLNHTPDDDNDDQNEPIVYNYNNLDIDFNSLMQNESNKTIKQIHEYMANDTGTLQNEYTGMFKNKNLILFMAESFNEIAVSKELTPTLYKLVNSGFVFENFYTPTIYSTIGGEFQELTGLYAQSVSILSQFRTGKNSFPEGIGNKFEEINYNTYAYHNNSYNFQDRNKYLASLGFDNFKACYNGLEKLINCKIWPQSDVEMINATVDDYINEDKFMVFYSTVSGHATYSWSANAMAKKHREEYNKAGFNYSEHPASYLAANMELDQMLELLIKKLDEKGILGDTVIALVGDHYPYELTIDEINEVSSYKKDDVVTVNKSNFILWNSEMDTIKVDKVGSQIDVIPTIYNTFGIKYDSRLFIGKDILSTEGGLAMFGNRSWVTDKGTYFAASRKFVPASGVEVEDDYVKTINQIVNNKITMSKLIIENNYYGKVFK